jgi:hypothetical protein
MAKQKGPPISLSDGDVVELTFIYGNCRRIKSVKAKGYFWGFDCKEGQLSANKSLAKTIKEYWPGRGGSLTIQRNSATDYEVVDGVKTENAQYDLEQVEWNNAEGAYTQIPWNGGSGPPGITRERVNTPATRSNTKPNYSWIDLQSMYVAAFDMAEKVVPTGESAGEKAARMDVRWKMAYSVVADAIRMGMTPQTIAEDLTQGGDDPGPSDADAPDLGDDWEEVDEQDLPFE